MNKIIIQIPLNVLGQNKIRELDEVWIKRRVQLFIEYTLQSLKAQSNQYFTALLRCRDASIPLVSKMLKGKLPENVIIVGVEEFEKQIIKLSEGYDSFYWLRLDSDDMYINTFIEILQNYTPKPETEVLISQNCYAYEIYQKRLAYFFYPSPQSYALIYNTKEFVNGKRYFLKNGHGGAILLKHELIPGNNYIDTVHDGNNSSTWIDREGKIQFAYKGIPREEIKDKKIIKNILREFGIFQEGENNEESI